MRLFRWQILIGLLLFSGCCINNSNCDVGEICVDNQCIQEYVKIKEIKEPPLTEEPKEEWYKTSWTLMLHEQDEQLITQTEYYAKVVKDNYTIKKVYTKWECPVECKHINRTDCTYVYTTCEKIFNISELHIEFRTENDGKIYVESHENIPLYIDFDGYTNLGRWN